MPGHGTDTGRLVVVGVDGSTLSREALRWACSEAELTGGRVRAVTVRQRVDLLPGSAFGMPSRRQAAGWRPEAGLHHEVTLVATTAPVQETVAVGDPAGELVAACADADLLVLGAHGDRPWRGTPLGGVAAACVRHARCPVVLLPAMPSG